MIKSPLVWIDCEMTGLDIKKDHLIEIAVLITDGDLNIVAKGPELVIYQPKEIMDSMNGNIYNTLASELTVFADNRMVH
ncbi:hypothetical protein G6F46_010544 [Rhizopus delemar]|uniref:Exonuclease domain-containing protein n=2 Tax=Rhizopus TaxID=4842 RepID=A0A9P6YUZ2_9FUNG|nr:hypothetical protein G6F55_012640 [Rhizopus delemar]KAG1537133.1 hypothetical protein G6F51_010556 [Rhizopus arrhizus]KAG1496762.1 hypothetical protein G6F54_006247 [Rhizopus delemar]KAG1502945.1 hypothetical protein G6F52_012322 [Rhizopus delemar]KAG1504998.1 hypothetical protein G6F53_010279 [Rhizopus delemar]